MLAIVVHLLLLTLFASQEVRCGDPDETRTTAEIIESRGFIAETHDVETEDGYIIQIFRIVHPFVKSRGKPVLLQHPLTGESANWLINSPAGFVNENNSEVGNNLGFELAKRGYDVWLGNVRGNTYGLRHRSLTPDDSKFWQFSIDEHSAYDLPAMIHYIQNVTGSPKIDYVGHSQGTMIMFALLSRIPEYSQVVDRFIALGPVAFLGQVTSPLKYLLDSFLFKSYLNWSSGSSCRLTVSCCPSLSSYVREA